MSINYYTKTSKVVNMLKYSHKIVPSSYFLGLGRIYNRVLLYNDCFRERNLQCFYIYIYTLVLTTRNLWVQISVWWQQYTILLYNRHYHSIMYWRSSSNLGISWEIDYRTHKSCHITVHYILFFSNESI